MKFFHSLCVLVFAFNLANAQVSPQEQFKFAKYQFDQKAYDKALSYVDQAIAADDSYANAYFLKASILFEIEAYEPCVRQTDRALELADAKSATAADLLLLRGRANVSLGKDEEALQDFNQSILVSASDAEAFRLRSELKKSMNDYRGAIADISHAIKISDPVNARFYAIRADLLNDFYKPKIGSDEYDLVLSDINKSIELEPENYDFYAFRSDFYVVQKQKEAAMEDLTAMINMAPARGEAYATRGLLHLQSYDYMEAVRDFTNSIRLNPENEENYRYRALCLHNMSRYRDAHKDLSRSINMLSEKINEVNYQKDLQMTLAETYIQRGLCLTRMGNASGSCGDFLQAVELGVRKGRQYFKKFCERY